MPTGCSNLHKRDQTLSNRNAVSNFSPMQDMKPWDKKRISEISLKNQNESLFEHSLEKEYDMIDSEVKKKNFRCSKVCQIVKMLKI